MARFWKTAAFILATAYFVVDGVLSYVTRPRDFGAGAITFVTAEALKLTFVEQLFQLNRKKLLSIPAFASGYHSGYHYRRRMMDLVESMEAWKATRKLADNTAHLLRTRWLQFSRSLRQA